MEIDDERERAVLIGGRQRDVDVERDAVEALDARAHPSLAELHPVARDARDAAAEDGRDRGGGGARNGTGGDSEDERKQADRSHGGRTYGSRTATRKQARAGDRAPRAVSGSPR